MKHLAILSGSDIRTYGGGEKYVIELVKRLKKFDKTVYSFVDKDNIRFNNKEIKNMLKAKLIYYNTLKIPLILKRSVPLTLSGLHMLNQVCKCDTVYIMYPSAPIILMILLYTKLKKSKAKIIFGVHNPDFINMLAGNNQENIPIKNIIKQFHALIYKKTFFKVPNIHVLNDSDQKMLKKYGYKGNIYKIPNFLYYKKSNIKVRYNKSKFIVLFGGRLAIYQKGIDLLINIIKKVTDKNKNIEFQIFGSGEDGQELIENLSKGYKNVKYLGFISDSDLEKEYKNSSLYIMTSRIEAFPSVILEAQAHGLPVIAFGINGPKDAITSFSGSIIKSFDVDAFANEILRYYYLWKDDKLDSRYKNRIVDYIFSKYSDKIIIPKIQKMFMDKSVIRLGHK